MPSGFTHIKEHRVAIIGRTKFISTPIAGKKFFPNHVLLLQNFQRNVFLFHSENIGISNWQLRSSIKSES